MPEPSSGKVQEKKYTLEFLVKANNWERVVTVLKYWLDIEEKQKTNSREIDGLFMVSVEIDGKNLTKKFYSTVKNCDELAIVADESSVINAREINEEIYKVETQLRRLLLHVSDLVEAFLKVVGDNTRYAKDFTKSQQIISVEHYEPVTSHMTLGEMITILDFDISWSSRNLNITDLHTLFKNVRDLKEVQDRLDVRAKRKTVWDIINTHVLDSKVDWKDIFGPLNSLKDFRNGIAHFLVVTSDEKQNALRQAEHVLSKIKIDKTLSTKQKSDLKTASIDYAKTFNRLSDIYIHATLPNLGGAVAGALSAHRGVDEWVQEQNKKKSDALRRLLAPDASPLLRALDGIGSLSPNDEQA
jgi:hypothetical protein